MMTEAQRNKLGIESLGAHYRAGHTGAFRDCLKVLCRGPKSELKLKARKTEGQK